MRLILDKLSMSCLRDIQMDMSSRHWICQSHPWERDLNWPKIWIHHHIKGKVEPGKCMSSPG